MTVWVDVDSCAREARRILARAAGRAGVSVTMVGDRAVPEGKEPQVTQVILETGKDAADRYIRERVEARDLVVTRDLPFAEEVALRGVTVLNDRGDVFTSENIAERRSVRDFMYELRQDGIRRERGRTLGKRQLQDFANALDREITRRLNRG
ncbi:MAG: DUF188 domain-containing protein [Spirochaetaceae bacterium]